jgi:hypothetical protein
MGLKAGTLLWNRMRITLPPPVVNGGVEPSSLLVNTGLCQPNRNFADQSPDEPTLGSNASVPSEPMPGSEPQPPVPPALPSRVQVVPMAPTAAWEDVTHGEPFVDPTTGLVWVQFFHNPHVNVPPESVEINVLFWDPHTMVGPGQAMTYAEQPVDE